MWNNLQDKIILLKINVMKDGNKAKRTCSKLTRLKRKSNAASVPRMCPGLGEKKDRRNTFGDNWEHF